MSFSLLMEFLFLFTTLITTSISSYNINLFTRYSPTYITLTCKTYDPDASSFMIHLSCPLVRSGFCFSNCTAYCTFDNNENCVSNPSLGAIVACEYNKINEQIVSTSYQISTSQIHTTGDWSCSFKNYKSNIVSLVKHESSSKLNVPADNTMSVPIEIINKEKGISRNVLLTSSTEKENIQTNAPLMENDYYLLDYMAKPELVIVLILLLALSLLLNLSFLIRCLLLKIVIQNYYHQIPNNKSLLECLCLSSEMSTHRSRRFSHSPKTSNQAGSDFLRHRPMCINNLTIYDDLSAMSNNSTKMKTRSNQSSEMDAESRRTTYLPNEICYVNQAGVGSASDSMTRKYVIPGHCGYIHPGLGNYVIMNGPVSSQEKYALGAAPYGYGLQIISPVPSVHGSKPGIVGTNHSTYTFTSDQSDTDSRTAQSTPTIPPHSQTRLKRELLDRHGSVDIGDQRHQKTATMSSLNHSLHKRHQSQNTFAASIGSDPSRSSSRRILFPATPSLASLQYYPVSGNRIYNQEIQELPTVTKQETFKEF